MRIPKRLLFLKTADFLILGGTFNKEKYIKSANVDKHTQIVHIHSLDYEAYLKTLSNENHLVGGKYWVFIDEYLPYHPDLKEQTNIKVDPDLYYLELRRFFHHIEEKYKVKVVVASHPRGDYSKHPEAYKGFQVFRYVTNDLIKDSEVVLSHFSTCDSYVTLYHKPIIHIATTCIKNTPQFFGNLVSQSKEYGSSIVDVSNTDYIDTDLMSLCIIDEGRFRTHIREYLKADYDGTEKDKESFYPQFEKVLKKALNEAVNSK